MDNITTDNQDGKKIILNDGGEVQITRVIAGLAWPGERPGFLAVIGEGKQKGMSDSLCFLLHEYEDMDSKQLIKKTTDARVRYGIDTVYAREDPYLQVYNQEASRRGQSLLYVSEPPNIESAGHMGAHIHFHLKTVKARLEPGQKSLSIPRTSRLPGYLTEVSARGIVNATDVTNPAAGAIAYSISAVDVWRYDPAEQAEVEAMNLEIIAMWSDD